MTGHLAMRRVALMFGALCLVLGIWYLAVRPSYLTIAVGPSGSSQAAYVATVARLMRETRQPYRLRTVEVDGSAAASRLLDARKVDLALLRSDDLTSTDARSIVIVHRRAVVLVARKDSGIETLRDIAGKRLAITAADTDSFRPVVERVMSHFDIDADDLQLEEMARADVPAAFASHAIDAVIIVANPAARQIRIMLSEIAGNQAIPIVISGAPAHDALAFRFRELQASDIPQGVFGGSPLRPEEKLDTVAITYEIVAGSGFSEQDATGLTKTLMELRGRLRTAKDNTFAIETPPVDEARRFLPHAGTAAYVNNEAKTWLEVYSEPIWLALFSMGLIGSSVAGILSWAGFRREAPVESLAGRMRILAGQVENARTPEEIDAIQGDFDDLVLAIMREYGLRNLVQDGAPDPSPWLTTFAALMTRRRAMLAGLEGGREAPREGPCAGKPRL